MKRIILLSGILMFAFMQCKAQTVKIEVMGIRNDKGNIMLMVEDKTAKKGDTCAMKPIYARVKAEKNSVIIPLKGVKAKEILLSVFHDENGNNQLDMDDKNRPAEGFAREKCSVNQDATTTIKVRLYYPVTE